jgi:hypothetical protein
LAERVARRRRDANEGNDVSVGQDGGLLEVVVGGDHRVGQRDNAVAAAEREVERAIRSQPADFLPDDQHVAGAVVDRHDALHAEQRVRQVQVQYAPGAERGIEIAGGHQSAWLEAFSSKRHHPLHSSSARPILARGSPSPK